MGITRIAMVDDDGSGNGTILNNQWLQSVYDSIEEWCATAKCAYCGLYGRLGKCDGCGANNQPINQEGHR